MPLTPVELRQQARELLAEADKLIPDDREMTEEEAKEVDDRMGKAERLVADAEKREKLQVRRAHLDASQEDPPRMPITESRKERPERLGEFMQAVAIANGHEELRSRVSDRVNKRATGLSEGVGADGGFLVGTDMSNELLKNVWDTAILPAKCRQVPISSGANSIKINGINETSRVDGSRWGGVQAYWTAEAAAKTASAPEFRQIELDLKKLVGLMYATDELLADAAALESIANAAFGEELGFKLDDAIIEGTGAGQPLGILNATCLVTVAKEAGQANTTLVAENVEKIYARMLPRSVDSSYWLINQECWPQIFKFSHAVGTGGAPMFIPAGGLSDTPYNTLMGRPILTIEQCQALGTKGDIFFADFSQYLLATKGGIDSAASIHLKFNYDETVFRWVLRVDGQPALASAITPFKGTATLSPFVTLAGRP